VGITAGSREVPGRNACDRRHTYCIIIIMWNEAVHTNREVTANRADIIIKSKNIR